MIYGIISDIHATHPKYIDMAVKVLIQQGAEALVLNGDLVGEGFSPQQLNEQEYASMILQNAAKTEKPVYAQAGSHEDIPSFEPVIQQLPQHFGNLIDVSRNPKIELGDHTLVFLPGSDWHTQGVIGYNYTMDMETGLYRTEKGPIAFTNINDLRKHVTEPEKTIVFTHVPRKFGNIKTAVDMAYFAERADKSLKPGVVVEKGITAQYEALDEDKKKEFSKHFGFDYVENLTEREIAVVASQNGYTFKRENRGNQDLATVMDEVGITKNITGHFHESAHRAHDLNCNPLKPKEFTEELFWNASYMDEGLIGLLHVDGTKVAYQNVNVSNFIK